MKRIVLTIAIVVTLVPAAVMAGAWTADDIVLSGAAGSGSNASYLVLDFNSTSYALKYLWDTGTPSGFDLLSALSAPGTGVPGLSFTYHESSGMGAMIDSISYGTHSGVSNYPDPWWNYWTGPVGGPIESSYVGVSSSPIYNGSVDAWVFTTDWTQSPKIPGVPEPSSILAMVSLIGLAGSVGLLRGRRR